MILVDTGPLVAAAVADDRLHEGMLRSAEHVTGPWRYKRIEGASHWMQLDAPARINELLLAFLA